MKIWLKLPFILHGVCMFKIGSQKASLWFSTILISALFSTTPWAASCNVDSSGNITSNCDDFTWSSGSVSNSYVISSVTQAPLFVINATPNTFTNTSSGSILGGTGLGIFVYFNSVVTAINNDGLVSSVNDHGLFNYYSRLAKSQF